MFRALLLTLFICVVYSGFSQKVDLDKKAVFTKLIKFPRNDVDTSLHTFSIHSENLQYCRNVMLDPDELLNTYAKLEGFNKVDSDGDYQIHIVAYEFQALEVNVANRVEKTKDKAGREISTTFYKYVLSYNAGVRWNLKDKNGKNIDGNAYIPSTMQPAKSEGKEFKSYKEAADSYTLNKSTIHANLAKNAYNGGFSSLYSAINARYGYRPEDERFILWVIGSKSHPDLESSNTNANLVADVFKKISPTGITEADMLSLQPALDYYLQIPKKYAADEKPQAKLRYMAYVNLATIYLHLDKFEKAEEYANLVIANDYDPKDGKDVLKEVEKLKKEFIEKKYSSRRFVRS